MSFKSAFAIIILLLFFSINGYIVVHAETDIIRTNITEKSLVLDDVFWVYAVSEVNISGIEIPAGTTAIVIVLKNEGNESVSYIKVDFSSILKIAECNETVKYFNDTLPPYYSVTFAFTVNLYENASASQYDLPLYVTYFMSDIECSYTIDIPVAVTGVPLLKIHLSPLYVSDAGEYNLTAYVENVGTAPARNVIVHTIGYPPYITIMNVDWVKLGLLKTGEIKKVTFRLYVTDLPFSVIPIVVNVTFMDQRTNDFYSVSETAPVILNITPRLALMSSSYVPTAVLPGDKYVKITVILTNPTSKIVEDCCAELILPSGIEPSYAGSGKVSLGTILPNHYVTVSFYVNILEDIEPKLYDLILNVTFKNGKQIFEVPLLVKEKARFKIVNIEPKTLPIGGRGVNFRVTIMNIAKIDAEAVYLQLMGGAILKGEVVTYVGKISAGEMVTTTFIIEISENAPEGSASLDLKVSWTQEDRVLYEIYKLTISLKRPLSLPLYATASFILLGGLAILLSIPLVRYIRRIKSLSEV